MNNENTLLDNSYSNLEEKISREEWVKSSEVAKNLDLSPKTIDGYCNKEYVRSEKINEEWYIHPDDLRYIDMCHRINISAISQEIKLSPKILQKLDEEVNFINELKLVSKDHETRYSKFIDPEIANRLKLFKKAKNDLGLRQIQRNWLTHLYDFDEDFQSFTESLYNNNNNNIESEAAFTPRYPEYDPSKKAEEYEIGTIFEHRTLGVCEVVPRFDNDLNYYEQLKKYGKHSPFLNNDDNIENERYCPMIKVKKEDNSFALLRASRNH